MWSLKAFVTLWFGTGSGHGKGKTLEPVSARSTCSACGRRKQLPLAFITAGSPRSYRVSAGRAGQWRAWASSATEAPAWPASNSPRYFIPNSFDFHDTSLSSHPIVQMRKLRLREVSLTCQGHRESKEAVTQTCFL